jgi:hypothetical protein
MPLGAGIRMGESRQGSKEGQAITRHGVVWTRGVIDLILALLLMIGERLIVQYFQYAIRIRIAEHFSKTFCPPCQSFIFSEFSLWNGYCVIDSRVAFEEGKNVG